MSYFQNVFTADFEGNWLLGDRHHIPKFVCPRNNGRGDEQVMSWENAPYNLSGVDSDGTNDTDTLSITFALNDAPQSGVTFKNWATITVDITQTATDSTNVAARDIVTDLNGDATFYDRFEASIVKTKDGFNRVAIHQKMDATRFRFYINNGGAEDIMQFNQRAGVAELPTFFDRHTMANRFVFDDCQNHLIALDPTNGVDERLIEEAMDAKGNFWGFDASVVQADWQLLRGRSGLFDFTNVVDGTTTIIYPAGARAGDLAKIIVSDGTNTFVMPHTLEAADLITPP